MDIKSLVIVYSYHHKNTEKVANAIAGGLNAEVKYPPDVSHEEIQKYDLIGFGAGIDGGKHYEPLIKFAEALPSVKDKKAFIFSTSAVRSPDNGHKALRDILESKGFSISGEYSCRGFTTRSIFNLVGGKNKDRPNAEDLKEAEDFARRL